MGWQEHEHYSDPLFGNSADFSRDLKEKEDIEHAHPPSYIAAASATAGYVLMKAVVAAYDGSNLPSQERVAEALFAERGHNTFFGPVGFKECTQGELDAKEVACGSNELKPMITTQVQDGEIKIVAPLEQADGALLYPAPIAADTSEVDGATYIGLTLSWTSLLFCSLQWPT